MNRCLSIACLFLISLTTLAAAADKPTTKPASTQPAKSGVKWAIEPDPKLPNVLILGDSISLGYTLQVRHLLGGKANVFHPLTADGKAPENCNGTTYGVTHIDHWLDGRKWDVIHFNFGLHDLKHVKKPGDDAISTDLSDPVQATPEEYAKNLETIVKKLKATGAKLIFATTTPVPEGADGRTADEPAKYNAVALKIMHDNGIAVDDLFTAVEPHLAKYQQAKNVHYKAEGYRFLSETVSKSIEAQLGSSSHADEKR